jgi:hypothetical protein
MMKIVLQHFELFQINRAIKLALKAQCLILQRKVGRLPVREQLHCEQDAVQLHPKQA